jgi:glycosyltransferase involved in cell wall biosynthesis
MVSFQHKLAGGFARRGVEVGYDLNEGGYDALLVIGGTRDLSGLWHMRRQGVHIVQRLNGMNWLHRICRTGLRHYIRSEYGNLILRLIRSRLSDAIVYQSGFAKDWWEGSCGVAPAPARVIYNGVDLDNYTPYGTDQRPKDRVRLLLVEGSLGGGYEIGLETAVSLAEELIRVYRNSVELMVVGKVSESLRSTWQAGVSIPLVFTGQVPQTQVPEIDRSSHLLYSADIHGACPNSVIEALACGLPVIAFDTGALPELVSGDAGIIVPYGGNAWRLEPPDIKGLAQAAVEILNNIDRFRNGARERAEQAFGLEKMVDAYLEILLSA